MTIHWNFGQFQWRGVIDHCLYLFFLFSSNFSVWIGILSVLSSTFVNVFSREKGERKGRRIDEREGEEGEKKRERGRGKKRGRKINKEGWMGEGRL